MILERLLHRIESCSLSRWRQHGPKSPLRLHSTSDRNCTTSFHKKLNHLMGPWRIKLSHVIQRAHSYHTVPSLKVMERFGRAAFLSGTTYGVVSTVLLVFSRRNAMFCLAMSCPIKQHHGRYSQKRRQGPEDALWWRTATKEVPMARDSISPIRFWKRITST